MSRMLSPFHTSHAFMVAKRCLNLGMWNLVMSSGLCGELASDSLHFGSYTVVPHSRGAQ